MRSWFPPHPVTLFVPPSDLQLLRQRRRSGRGGQGHHGGEAQRPPCREPAPAHEAAEAARADTRGLRPRERRSMLSTSSSPVLARGQHRRAGRAGRARQTRGSEALSRRSQRAASSSQVTSTEYGDWREGRGSGRLSFARQRAAPRSSSSRRSTAALKGVAVAVPSGSRSTGGARQHQTVTQRARPPRPSPGGREVDGRRRARGRNESAESTCCGASAPTACGYAAPPQTICALVLAYKNQLGCRVARARSPPSDRLVCSSGSP